MKESVSSSAKSLMAPRTKAVLSAIAVTAVSVVPGWFLPAIVVESGLFATPDTSTPVSYFVMHTCGWWWIVPGLVTIWLLIECVRRPANDRIFKWFYIGFTFIVGLMCALIIAIMVTAIPSPSWHLDGG